MRVHRSAHTRSFTVLPNVLLQDRRLSYTARGLLADLLSRPDGWREDGRQMADSSTQGRGAIRRALKELTEAGYYRVDRLRMADGTVRSVAHVFDTPQSSVPGVPHPVAGEATTGPAGAPPVKDVVKEPTLPAEELDPAAPAEPVPRVAPAEPDEPDEQTRAAAATLFRVVGPEPRLRLGEAEALALAPLVAQWLERGCTVRELAQALLPGLPAAVYSPVGVLRSRLVRKMPPSRSPDSAPAPAEPSYAECAKCHDPVPQPGICRTCAGLGTRLSTVGGGAAATLVGAARHARGEGAGCRAARSCSVTRRGISPVGPAGFRRPGVAGVPRPPGAPRPACRR